VPLPVLLAIQEARAASSEAERAVLAARLNQQLDTLEAGAAGRQVADLLHGLLESDQLAGLEDVEGRTCRAAATEALLRLGFPFALEVRPEDLAQWLALTDAPTKDGPLLPLVLLLGLSLMALVPAVLGPERSNSQRAGLLGLLILALIQLYLGVFGGYYGTLSGAAGLLAWLLLWLPRR
jgi:hypothetical protein